VCWEGGGIPSDPCSNLIPQKMSASFPFSLSLKQGQLHRMGGNIIIQAVQSQGLLKNGGNGGEGGGMLYRIGGILEQAAQSQCELMRVGEGRNLEGYSARDWALIGIGEGDPRILARRRRG